jgi:hypothetical protein
MCAVHGDASAQCASPWFIRGGVVVAPSLIGSGCVRGSLAKQGRGVLACVFLRALYVLVSMTRPVTRTQGMH